MPFQLRTTRPFPDCFDQVEGRLGSWIQTRPSRRWPGLELVRQQEHEMAEGCFVVKPVFPNPNPSPLRCSLIASPTNHSGSTMVWRSAPPPPPMHPARSADASSRRRTPCWTLDEFQKNSGATRSPSYQLTRPYTWVRVRGTGTIRQMVDGYWMNEHNALLFGDHLQNIDSDRWQLIRFHNVRTRASSVD